jgi:osmotically-inducible protein OsmY
VQIALALQELHLRRVFCKERGFFEMQAKWVEQQSVRALRTGHRVGRSLAFRSHMRTSKSILLMVCVAIGAAGFVGCEREPQVGGRPANARTAGEELDDKTLTANVTEALHADPMKFPDVQVTSYRGVVQLSGFADTRDQKNRADDIAKRVPGVKKVENNITVKEAKAP